MMKSKNLISEDTLKIAEKYGRKPYMTAEDMKLIQERIEEMNLIQERIKEDLGLSDYLQRVEAALAPFKRD